MALLVGLCVRVLTLVCLCSSDVARKYGLKMLEEFLFEEISTTIPPFNEEERAISVNMTYDPIAILDLNSANEVLSVSSHLQLIWWDEDIWWDPENFSGHAFIEVDSSAIWTPKVIVSDSILDGQPIESKSPVIVTSEGDMRWEFIEVFHTRCKIDVQYYPFDTQICKITFVPPYGYRINLQGTHTSYNATNLAPKSGEWTLLSIEFNSIPVVGSVGLSAGQFSLTLRREFVYHIINIIFPMGLLSILNPCVFLIPASSGEKLAFLMAVFVSHAMFLNLIHQSMPPTSDAVSTLAMFLALIEVQGFLTILATILVLCVHHKKEKEAVNSQVTKEKVEAEKDTRVCNWTLERFLDGIFFFVSFSMGMVGCVTMWLVSR